jgi:chromatin remodeling complex protein RSC6
MINNITKKNIMSCAVDQPIEFCHSMIVPTKLYKFLSLKDNKLPRPEVVKKIYEYVADKNLRSNENRRIIIPDEAIKELFNLEEGEKLDFKNFQKSVAKIYKDYLKERKTDITNLFHTIGLSEWRAINGKPKNEQTSIERMPEDCLSIIGTFLSGNDGTIYQQKKNLKLINAKSE